LLPPWFGDNTPILDALLQGMAWSGSFVHGLYVYAKQQTRIKTASGGWLDLVAHDFFGGGLKRAQHQSDASFRSRILARLLRERATRKGVVQVLEDLTGRTPGVFEPLRPLDTGAYSALYGYDAAGGYGSRLLPFQAFVTAYRPAGTGIPNINGYGDPAGGYGAASQAEYAALAMIEGAVTDADIYAAVDGAKPVGSILWTRIGN